MCIMSHLTVLSSQGSKKYLKREKIPGSMAFKYPMLYFYGQLILGSLFTSIRVKTAEVVSKYFTIR